MLAPGPKFAHQHTNKIRNPCNTPNCVPAKPLLKPHNVADNFKGFNRIMSLSMF